MEPGAVRSGSALVIVILGMLLLEVVVAGSLTLAASGAATTSLGARRLEARLSAESAVRAGFAQVAAWGWDTLPAGAVTRIPDMSGTGSLEVEALGGGRLLLRGSAPGAGVHRTLALALVHVLPRDSLRAVFDAALRGLGSVRIGAEAVIDGTGREAAAVCEADPVPGVIAAPGELEEVVGATVDGAPPVRVEATAAVAGVSGLSFAALRPLADAEAEGSVTPVAAGCAGAGAWGTPESACLVFAPGDLTVAGGEAHVMLVVMGRLRLVDGARLRGAVIAGAIDVMDAEIVGAVRVTGTDTSRVDGVVRYDACVLGAALSAPALRRAFRRGSPLWLPAR